MKTPLLFAAFAFISGQAIAQAAFPPPPPKVSPAAGVIDLHVHSHLDVFGRNMDDIDVAQIYEGSIQLEESEDLGGLLARLKLPLAP